MKTPFSFLAPIYHVHNLFTLHVKLISQQVESHIAADLESRFPAWLQGVFYYCLCATYFLIVGIPNGLPFFPV